MNLTVTLLGTGVGIPQPGRSQSSLLVQDGLANLLFDCGAGTLLRLSEVGLDPLDLDAVFLSHLHLDHVSDLLALAKARYLQDRPELEVYGPLGTERWLRSVQSLYPYLKALRPRVHELFAEEGIELGELYISTAEAVHSVTCLGYRVDGSKSMAYSGDTEPAEGIVDLARGVDLLVHECSFPEPSQVTNHSTPLALGRAVRDVGRVVLTHFYPQAQGHEEEMAAQVAAGAGVPVQVGRDLMRLEL